MKIKISIVTPLCAALLLSGPLASAHGNEKLKVMTRNLYLGADIFKVVEAAMIDPASVPLAVTAAFNEVQQTNFLERAEAIADEIKRARPDAIGLQEVSTIYTQTPSDFGYGGYGLPEKPADTVFIDYVDVLQAALRARGLHYTVAVQVQNADIELPMVTGLSESGPELSDLRLVDRDVILVSNRTIASNPLSGNYSANVAMEIGGENLEFTRGYAAVDISVKGELFRFVNTHLETGGSEPFRSIQAVQMSELLTILDMTNPAATPVVLVGDFNSSPEARVFVSQSGIPGLDGQTLAPAYLQAVGSGYADSWKLKKKKKKNADSGFTCCFSSTLNNPNAQLTSRIDHIFVLPQGNTVKKVKSIVLGDERRDLTPNGLWPSDHAGVAARIKFKSQR